MPIPAAPRGAVRASTRNCSSAPRRRSICTASRARDCIGIADFSQPSRDPRFHVVNLPNGTVESYPRRAWQRLGPGALGLLDHFSNQPGSEATSNGTYTTGDYYHGKYGLSMKVRGLDWTNNNAESRAIVIHNAWYAEPDMVDAARQARPLAGLLRFLARRPVEGDEQARRRPHDLRGQALRLTPTRRAPIAPTPRHSRLA